MVKLAVLGALVSWTAPAAPVWIAVVNRGENTVSLIDQSGKADGETGTGAGPHEVAARKQIATVDVAPLSRPHGLVCAGEFVYFTAKSNLAIGRIRLADAKFDLIIGHGQKTGHMIVRAADVLYVRNISSGTVAGSPRQTGRAGTR